MTWWRLVKQAAMSIWHKAIHLVYMFLSFLPDCQRFQFYFTLITRLRAVVLGWQPNKDIGENVRIWRRCRISMSSRIAIGNNCVIKEHVLISGDLSLGTGGIILAYTTIDASGGVKIGSKTHVGRFNVIFSHTHDVSRRDVPVLEAPEIHKPVEIGNDVMLFSRVAVLAGVKIGNGAIVGYGSVVTSDLDAYGIYAGVPARRIGDRE